MRPFSLHRPTDLRGALDARSQGAAVYVAGGTNLIDLMKLRVEQPGALVDLSGLPDLDRIETTVDGGLRVGALVTMRQLADHPAIQRGFPMIAQALNQGASAQLRNMATLGGNLLQRTRCAYFRDVATACNKREPGSGCDAWDGLHRDHALLGVSPHCIALHPSDLCVALIALDVHVVLQGPQGDRTVPLARLHRLPGDTPHLEHDLQPGELITTLVIDPHPAAARSGYLKIRDRESYQFAVVSVAAAVQLDADGSVRQARIGLGGVGAKPWRADAAEDYLRGRQLDDGVALEAGRLAMQGAQPRPLNAFKIPLMRQTVATLLLTLAQDTAPSPTTEPQA